MPAIRCLLVDDHEFARDSIARDLAAMPRVDLVGVAEDLIVALERDEPPDVVVLDLSLPGVCRRDAIPRVLARWPKTRVLAMTVYPTGPDFVLSLGDGAHGYVVKDIGAPELARAVGAVANGSTYYAPIEITYHTPRALRLTPLQRAVLREIARGATDAQAASALCRAPRTVESDIRTIRFETGLAHEPRSRALLTRFAMEHDPYCKLSIDEHPRP